MIYKPILDKREEILYQQEHVSAKSSIKVNKGATCMVTTKNNIQNCPNETEAIYIKIDAEKRIKPLITPFENNFSRMKNLKVLSIDYPESLILQDQPLDFSKLPRSLEMIDINTHALINIKNGKALDNLKILSLFAVDNWNFIKDIKGNILIDLMVPKASGEKIPNVTINDDGYICTDEITRIKEDGVVLQPIPASKYKKCFGY